MFHAGFLFTRSFQAGHPPLTNMFETLHLLAFLIILLFFIGSFWRSMDLVGGFSGIVSTILIAFSATTSSEIEPLLPALKSNWLLFHVTANFIAYASFALAMGAGFAYLFIDFIKFKKMSQEGKAILLKRLDGLIYRFILFGYPLLTLGIATGSIWADLSWGRYWNWDAKEVWAFLTWIVYAVYLHLRYFRGFSPRWSAVVVILSFGVVIFTYMGVNLWLPTLHQYA